MVSRTASLRDAVSYFTPRTKDFLLSLHREESNGNDDFKTTNDYSFKNFNSYIRVRSTIMIQSKILLDIRIVNSHMLENNMK